MYITLPTSLYLSLVSSCLVLAHGNHAQQEPLVDFPDENDSWAIKHLVSEHHIANMDPSAFFSLHDYDRSGSWTRNDVRRTYGLDDDSAKTIGEEKKQEVVNGVMGIFDNNQDGAISQEEFVDGWLLHGKRLPDYGTGPGHHGDDEYEYEIHHFEKYHDENTKEEDLIHPEDIEHFKKHDQMDAAAERQEMLDRMPIVEMNIPEKFRRH